MYQNYDFMPGDKIVFEDDFRGDADGEFPAHWKLEAGQGVINKKDGEQWGRFRRSPSCSRTTRR